ncbi:MAG: bifunctional UDP-N-acetylglucosamine diphosphorylase/glucosamine-1-phosphate N-acetyltransferase GlmU [Candidatus Atribacteria bacterium]|nr:MAG: bifunctional UDP-N-acetylglucosamine diphosphorylase/glucosamine-1-phosphate N-acetyltransferase GlmU [Candidatus Atribacteria bacterium]
MGDTAVIIMAAGKGKRMKSNLPKVLHNLAGKPILNYVLDTVDQLKAKRKILIVGHKSDQIRELIGDKIEYVEQKEQLGTAHAVLQTKKLLSDFKGDVLILSGDVPFLTVKILKKLLKYHQANNFCCTLVSTILKNPKGYGRIIRDKKGEIKGIIEEVDLSADKKKITEINSGIYCVNKDKLFQALEKITPDNKQGEYYLTDSVEILLKERLTVGNIIVKDYSEILGINSRLDLADASQKVYQKTLQDLMLQGVTIVDPNSTFIERGVKIGQDTIIYPFTIIEKDTKIESGCLIGPYSHLIDADIGKGVRVWASTIESSTIKEGANIGPYAHLRPETVVEKGAKIGNFVEVKKSTIGEGSKASHLTYLGDAIIGKRVNIGAGTITCNYDGEKKYKTIIENEVFIGSNNTLVAPVKLGKDSYTGAGSTITEDVPAGNLAIARSRQRNISGWRKRKKKKKNKIDKGKFK